MLEKSKYHNHTDSFPLKNCNELPPRKRKKQRAEIWKGFNAEYKLI